MRLIDADEIIKDRVENDPVRIAAECAPTAFDKEKVIEELRRKYEKSMDIYDVDKKFNPECASKGIADAYKTILDVVKKGGIE